MSQQLQQLQQCKHFVLIIRNGLKQISYWLPYLKAEISFQFIKKRYELEDRKPQLHQRQFQQFRKLVYQSPLGVRSICFAKPILLPIVDLSIRGKVTEQILKEMSKEMLKDLLKEICERNIEGICRYIFFLRQKYREQIVVLYRFDDMGLALKYAFFSQRQFIRFVKYDEFIERQRSDSMFLMVEPFLRQQQDLAKTVISKIASISVRIEYFQLSFQEGLQYMVKEFIYPSIFQGVQLNAANPQKHISKRPKMPQRKITVYFDINDESREKDSEKIIICDSLDSTVEQIQTKQDITTKKICEESFKQVINLEDSIIDIASHPQNIEKIIPQNQQNKGSNKSIEQPSVGGMRFSSFTIFKNEVCVKKQTYNRKY